MRFGRILVLAQSDYITRPNGRMIRTMVCRCDCGTEKLMAAQKLSGGTISCGCATRDAMDARNAEAKHLRDKHPGAYNSWAKMRSRCLSPGDNTFKRYGAKGITVCDRWSEFANFIADMGDRPPGHSIDRFPDTRGNYEPGNCRWATASQQMRNTTRNVVIEFDGRSMVAMDWAIETGIPYRTIQSRRARGWPVEKILGG